MTLFNLFKRFKSKISPAGFWCGAVFVSENSINADSGVKKNYSCSFLDFKIDLEYDTYDYTTNILGVSTVSFKNTIINKENHNLKLTTLSPIAYVKKYFESTIKYACSLNIDQLNVIYPFFKTEAVANPRSLGVGLSSTYPYGSVYNISFKQDENYHFNYNSYFYKSEQSALKTFQIISYNDMVFNYIYNYDYNHLSKVYSNQIEQIEKINNEINRTLDNNTFTVQDYNNRMPSIFVNNDKNAFLLYQVINSEKNYYGSHFDTVDEFFNSKSLHIYWMVDFARKQTFLHIFIYDDNQFVEEYKHSMDTKFNENLVDFNYYSGYLNNLVDKLIHCHYPRRKMIELMDSESLLDTFDGTLKEDEYYLFKMINI